MKKIKEPDWSKLVILTPAEMNHIHFGGIKSPLTPEQLEAIARAAQAPDGPEGPAQAAKS